MTTKAELWERVRKRGKSLPYSAPVVMPIMRPVALPCLHRGNPTAPPDRMPTAKTWYGCDHPDTPLGAVVCSCRGCGPSCRGYEPDGPDAAPPAVLITGGIGDFITVEGLLTPAERDRLEVAYYAAPAAREIEQLFRALPNYPRLKEHVILPTGNRTLYSLGQVESVVGKLPSVRDLSINLLFPRKLPYLGSSLLLKPLCPVTLPDKPYVVVVPRSTWFAPSGRAFDERDWQTCLATLECHDLFGVVLCRERGSIPAHSRLLDYQGKTSILEAVELLKGAQGYLGIDSWQSVLAAKLFPEQRLSVKCVPGCHGWHNRDTYFAPRRDFAWLTAQLEMPAWN